MPKKRLRERENLALREKRQARRAAGLCVDCSDPAGGAFRCEPCRLAINELRAYRRALGWIGKDILPYLRDADYEGRELRLPLGQVRRILRRLDG